MQLFGIYSLSGQNIYDFMICMNLQNLLFSLKRMSCVLLTIQHFLETEQLTLAIKMWIQRGSDIFCYDYDLQEKA